LRRRFIAYVKTLDPRRLVFLDEAGSHIAMTRDYGRAPRGERVHGSVPRNRGEVTTMIGALDVRGMRAMMTVEGGTDADVFEAFVEQVLVRKLRPGDIVVLDNVGAHKPDRIRRLVEAAGARLLAALFAGPQPYRTRLEQAQRRLQGLRRQNSRRTRRRLRRGMDLIGADDARAWFTHCGYQAHGN